MRTLELQAPWADWTSMSYQDHFVQFYEEPQFLLSSVAQYLFHGLKTHSACIAIASEEHRSQITELIDAYGIDAGEAERSGRLVLRDAAATLATFMVDGLPDEELFDRSIGDLIREVGRRAPSLRAFGEMVALLNSDGNRAGAIRLEELWHRLKEKHTFSLFCAYPLEGFGGAGSAEGFKAVCEVHTKVVPAETYGGYSFDERLRSIATLQQRVKELESELATLKGQTGSLSAQPS